MKRPQKVTPESRLNQYARKMYGKEKFEKQWDEDYETESLTGKKGDKKKDPHRTEPQAPPQQKARHR